MKVKGSASVWILSSVLLLSAGYLWQSKGKQAANPPQKPTAADNTSSGTVVSTGEVPPPLAFPATWPAPLAKPAGTPQQAAATLASTVLAGGSDTLPALERAALESGFSIHDQDGKILLSPAADADNGMSMLDLDLVVAAEGAKRKTTVTYDYLQKQLGADVDFPINELLPKAIIEGMNSARPSQQLWANFILQLGIESNQEFDPIGATGDTRVSSPQACFLLYEAAGQAWAATGSATDKPTTSDSNPAVPPAENPPAVPPASDPPPSHSEGHGPFLVNDQAGARDAAFRDLAQDMTSLSGTEISNYIQSHPSSTPHNSILGLERLLLLSTCTTINLKMTGAPLVRSSKTGNTGGERPIYVQVTFNVSDDVRRRYDAARKFVPSAKALPNQGIQDVNVLLTADPNVVVAKPDVVPTNGSQGQSKLVGATQKRDLPATPREDDYKVEVFASVPANAPVVQRRFDVPIRDWLDNGMELSIHITVSGQGTLTYSSLGGTLYWFIDRELTDATLLNYDYPQATLTPTLYDPKDPNRFTSYMKLITDPKKPSPDPTPLYHVDDLFLFDGPAGGCGNDNERVRTVKKIQSLPWKTQAQQPINPNVLQWDAKNKVYHFQFAYHQVPVVITYTGSPDQQTMMSVTDDLDIPKTLGIGFDQGTVAFPNVKATGTGIRDKYQVKSLASGSGNSEVTVQVDWDIRRINSPGSTGYTPPLLASEQAAINARIQSLLTNMMSSQSVTPQAMRPQETEDILEHRHGPLWLNDPSAATCSEIDIADGLPPSMLQRK